MTGHKPIEQLEGYAEIEKTVDIGLRLQEELGLIENPRYTWSIFPEWRSKIEADPKQKAAYMEALVMSETMRYKLIHHNYEHMINEKNDQIKRLHHTRDALCDELSQVNIRLMVAQFDLEEARERSNDSGD